jgi:hypothetical protein
MEIHHQRCELKRLGLNAMGIQFIAHKIPLNPHLLEYILKTGMTFMFQDIS